MNNIWSPWRAEYILGPRQDGCLFCDAPKETDSLLIKKSGFSFAIMNRFPYTTGHCMVAPMRHSGDISELSAEEAADIFSLVQELTAAIKQSMQPEGFNIGINMGAVAGAGIADHIHVHIVPRWKGDTNFMPVLSDVHIVSEHIEKTLAKIKGALS
jgi:ATP adenylyltransferase